MSVSWGRGAANLSNGPRSPSSNNKVGWQVCVFVNENGACSRWSARHPVGLIIKIETMKRELNKGGRPLLKPAARQGYIVSARLDSEHYFRLKKLARTSGCRPSEIIRQLIGRG